MHGAIIRRPRFPEPWLIRMPRDTLGHVFLRVRAITNARSLRLGLCNGKPHTASRMNIADIMLLYFITRVHRMRYATVRSRVSCTSPCRPCTRPHTYSVGHACEPPPSHRPSVLYILLYAARFRLPPVPFRNITLRASSWFSRVSKHAVIKGLHWRVPATGSASESASV